MAETESQFQERMAVERAINRLIDEHERRARPSPAEEDRREAERIRRLPCGHQDQLQP